MRQIGRIFFLFTILAFVVPEYAHPYIGPGAGITAIGTVLALLGAVLLAIVGFVWYPVKRLLMKRKGKNSKVDQKTSDNEKKGDAEEERDGDTVE